MIIKNRNQFLNQLKSSIIKKVQPEFNTSIEIGHNISREEMPDATGTMKSQLAKMYWGQKDPNAWITDGYGFIQLEKNRIEAVRRMQFGYQGLEPMTPELQEWLDAIGRPEWKNRRYLLVGRSALSSYRGNSNPIQLGYYQTKDYLEQRLKIKFQ